MDAQPPQAGQRASASVMRASRAVGNASGSPPDRITSSRPGVAASELTAAASRAGVSAPVS
jgi:hypothetical protein